MSPDLEKRLVEKFPSLFADYGKSPQESCMAWGCEHSDGWFGIILAMCRSIASHLDASKEPIEFKFAQIKEKFGTLRVYVDGGDEYIQGVVRMAEEMSMQTCEVTGLPGEMCRNGGWYRTLSREQARADGYIVCSDEKEAQVEGG